jgi:hypothetical protein
MSGRRAAWILAVRLQRPHSSHTSCILNIIMQRKNIIEVVCWGQLLWRWYLLLLHYFCKLFFFSFLNSFFFFYVHTLFGSFLHPAPLPHPFLLPSSVSGRSCSALWLILLKKRHMYNKKDKVFLLVKDSYTERVQYCSHVPMCYVPCWFNSNWSLHWFLISC